MKDPLTAHVLAEQAIAGPARSLLSAAVRTGLAFVVGSGIPLAIVLVAPDGWRVAATVTAVVVC